jgi:hypothetical protein
MLANHFFPLIRKLIQPITTTDSTQRFSPIDSIHVGVVSTNMGLQYGEYGKIDGFQDVKKCSNGGGDDGKLLGMQRFFPVKEDDMMCGPERVQCPEGYRCIDDSCDRIDSEPPVFCEERSEFSRIGEASGDSNDDLASQVACLSVIGTDGCGIEQQLEAAVRGVERNMDYFLKPEHLLVIIIVSDEEDCSIENNALFHTREWISGASGFLNVACNINAENESYLFDTNRYFEKLVAVKGGDRGGVLFSAIIGVPPVAACQGSTETLDAERCLHRREMQLNVEEFSVDKGTIHHFAPVCTRSDAAGNRVTAARPGRRFVKVAESFGANGFVYSICNEDWSPLFNWIGAAIAQKVR